MRVTKYFAAYCELCEGRSAPSDKPILFRIESNRMEWIATHVAETTHPVAIIDFYGPDDMETKDG